MYSVALRFGGDNTFDDNWGFWGGAIYNQFGASLSDPQDSGELIFQNIRGEVGADIFFPRGDSVMEAYRMLQEPTRHAVQPFSNHTSALGPNCMELL